MENDDLRWCLMMYDDVWRFMMIYEDLSTTATTTKPYHPKRSVQSMGELTMVIKHLPSGNLLHSSWEWHILFVDLPTKNGDFP